MTQNDQHMVQHFHLRYFGHTDLNIDREKKAMVRTYIDCLTSPNLNEYLQAIGFTYINLIFKQKIILYNLKFLYLVLVLNYF